MSKANQKVVIQAGPVLLYSQIYLAISDAIRSGELQNGDKLPTERDLSTKFGVSRATVRHALRQLTEDGVVVATVGRGSFVQTTGLEEPLNSLISFTELAKERGLEPSARVIQTGLRPASPEEISILEIKTRSFVFELIRVRLLDNQPIAIDKTRIPETLAIGFEKRDFSRESIYEALTSGGHAPTYAEVVVSAALATEQDALHLEINVGDPLIVCTSISFDSLQNPIELGNISYRADRYQIHTTLRRPF